MSYRVYYLLDKAKKITFNYNETQTCLNIEQEGESYNVAYQGKLYPSYEDFLNKATLGKEALVAKARSLNNFSYE